MPYEQSVALVKALKDAGDDADLITVPEGKHGFTPAQMDQLWPQIFQWLMKHKVLKRLVREPDQLASRFATTSVMSSAGGAPPVNSCTC